MNHLDEGITHLECELDGLFGPVRRLIEERSGRRVRYMTFDRSHSKLLDWKPNWTIVVLFEDKMGDLCEIGARFGEVVEGVLGKLEPQPRLEEILGYREVENAAASTGA